MEIEFDDGRKWKTSFPNKRVEKTALTKLNFVGEYNEAENLKSGNFIIIFVVAHLSLTVTQ